MPVRKQSGSLSSRKSPDVAANGAARLSDRAYEVLRRMIIELALEPGRRISEPELSDALGHSKASVRAALLRLSQERLLKPIARQGYEVSPLTIQDARNIFDLRLALEPSAAQQAAGRVRREDFRAVEKAFMVGIQPSKPDSFAKMSSANKEFRLIIARAGGNERLVMIVSGLLDELERYLRISFLEQRSNKQMLANVRALIDAMVRGDGIAAGEITRQQLTETADRVLAALLSRKQILGQPLAI